MVNNNSIFSSQRFLVPYLFIIIAEELTKRFQATKKETIFLNTK